MNGENTINKEKKQIDIFGDIYNLDDIDFFYVEERKLVFCLKDRSKKYNCFDASKCFRELVSEFIINGLENFILLVTTDCVVNTKNVKKLSKANNDFIIETKTNKFTLKNANFVEYMCLKGKIANSEQGFSK